MGTTALLTSSACAARLGVTRQTITRWIREQKLPARAIRVHGRAVYRIRPEDLNRFAERYVSDTWD